jgi:signal transduction histidine kinase
MHEQDPPPAAVPNPLRRSAARAGLAALVLIGVFFGAYEVVERGWLADSDPDLLRVLHLLRGVSAALITGALVTWLILRDLPPLLGEPPAEIPDERVPHAGPRRLHHARWFIRMRWIALVVATLLIVAAVLLAELLPPELAIPLLGLVGFLAVLNLGYARWLRRGHASDRFLAVQAYVDLVVLTLLLHFSGGVENPLTPLMLLHVIIAGVVLGRGEAFRIAAFGSVLFALLAVAEWSGAVSHYTLSIYPHLPGAGGTFHAAHHTGWVASLVVLQALILALVAHFTTTLAERVRSDERRLEAFADQAVSQAQLLERALDSTETALCVCGCEGAPIWSNSRWRTWLEDAPELGEMICLPAAPSPGATEGPLRFRELAVGGRAGPGGSSEGTRVFRLATARLMDRGGNAAHVATLAHEVTAQKLADARMVRAERLAAVGELAGQVAHEVNNPIAIINAKARLLLRDGRQALPAHAAGELAKIVELSDRVARIAQGLLSYCRPSPGVRTPLEVREPVRRALSFVEGRAREAGVEVTDALPDRLPPVLANQGELEQVFLNLFLNALDAMPAGGRLGVSATTWAGASGAISVIVDVTDTGPGIPPEVRDRLFEPFLTTKPDGAGTGLGLSICLGLVHSHGGEISVDSGPGRPTRFRVRLPAAPLSDPAPSRNIPLRETETPAHA